GAVAIFVTVEWPFADYIHGLLVIAKGWAGVHDVVDDIGIARGIARENEAAVAVSIDSGVAAKLRTVERRRSFALNSKSEEEVPFRVRRNRRVDEHGTIELRLARQIILNRGIKHRRLRGRRRVGVDFVDVAQYAACVGIVEPGTVWSLCEADVVRGHP